MMPVLERPLSLRRATDGDRNWAYEIKRAALKTYIEATWGPWHEERQRTWFESGYQPGAMEIIRGDTTDIGLLELHERPDHHYLAGLYLSPAMQNRGHGTALLTQIIRSAKAAGKPLRLQVLKVNPARRLYERLGFNVIETTTTHFVMRLNPAKGG